MACNVREMHTEGAVHSFHMKRNVVEGGQRFARQRLTSLARLRQEAGAALQRRAGSMLA
ncbi:MAG: hypothetical protein ACRD3N_02025 [Terracidiphilus sp.]